MNFTNLVLEQLTFDELEIQSEKDNLPEWRDNLDSMIGHEVCSLGAIVNGVNFLGPWKLIGRNPKKNQGGWVVEDVKSGVQKIVTTPRIYPIGYMTMTHLSSDTRDTFGDML